MMLYLLLNKQHLSLINEDDQFIVAFRTQKNNDFKWHANTVSVHAPSAYWRADKANAILKMIIFVFAWGVQNLVHQMAAHLWCIDIKPLLVRI